MKLSKIQIKVFLLLMFLLLSSCSTLSENSNNRDGGTIEKSSWLRKDGVESTCLSFFEIGSKTAMPYSGRFYSNEFKSEKVRFIFADMHIDMKDKCSGSIKAYVRSKWKLDGEIIRDSMYNPSMPCNDTINLWYGFGDNDPGAWWDSGRYEVEVYDLQDELLARGSFTIE